MVKSNICYLWEKSADLHKLPQNGKIEIPVGDAARNDLLFAILPNNTFTRTGENIECDPNEFDQKATLGTDFATGKAIITLKSAILFPAIHEVLMRVKGKDYPLFFRLDVSKIKFSGKKNPENLHSEVKDCKLVVKIPKKILRMPANYFDANNQLCTVDPKFGLQILESFHPFKTAGAFHVAAIEVPKLKNVISALKELEQIEKKIEQSPEKYIGKLPTSIEQKKQYKELKIKLGRLEKEREAKEKIVNNKETLNSIAKLLKSDKKTPAELKAAFDNYKGKSKDKHKKWSAAVDELQQIIVERDDSKNALLKLRQELTHMMKDKIALKDFASKKYTRTLVVEKKNAQEELKKLEEQLKQQVSNGMLQLQYAGKQYDQLEVKEIIQ